MLWSSLYESSDYSSFVARECLNKDSAMKPYDIFIFEKDEHFSVEDHYTAGNSSNESNTRPSDIFLKKKLVGLKPSILELNREKRKATLKFSGDNKDILQSTLSSSKNINLSGGLFVSREYENKYVKFGARMRCDLVNRMKDVTLAWHESVSSTSDKNVELSSVENHKIAPKADGPGNSSNENSSSPFDIFLKKKVMRLKPSFLELNREKKKAAKGFSGIVIRPGMVLLKNYLSINNQVMIVNKCRQLGLGEGGFYQPGFQDGGLLHLKMMCLGKNWDCQTRRYGEIRPIDGSVPPRIPVEFSQLVEKAIKESKSLVATNSNETKGGDEIPLLLPDICVVNFYTSTAKLGLHQVSVYDKTSFDFLKYKGGYLNTDKGESKKSLRKGLPIVSFSIGDSAEFLYGDQKDVDKADTLILESGDVLIFGERSRNVFHGVRSIRKDTAPKALLQETNLQPGRLNLTFRQY
ncbi:putative DNA oxidative demethylase [Arabidopsis thaliana]